MTHDQFIGLSGPDFEFPVELGKQREFASALHAFQPEFHEGRTPVMFPTLPIVAGYLWGYMLEEPRDTPLAALGMKDAMSLDAEQDFVFHGPKPRAGDLLIARTSVDRIWEKHGRRSGRLTFYRMRCDYRDAASGKPRLTLYSTSVVPENVPEAVPDSTVATSAAYLAPGDRRDQFLSIARRSPRGLRAGDTPGPVEMPPHTLTDCVRYQIATGSYGAAHHDVHAARAEGFPTWFGVAMYHTGLLCNYAVSWLGTEPLRRFSARFHDSTWPGDVLVYAGSVARVDEGPDGEVVTLDLSASRPDGTAVTTATAEFLVDGRTGA